VAFTVPSFPIMCNIWPTWTVPAGAPRVTSPCNLSVGRAVRAITNGWEPVEPLPLLTVLLLPPLTDVRDAANTGTVGDTVEVPAGSGRYYRVVGVDDVAKGFANEYRYATIFKAYDDGTYYAGYLWPTPIP
jgi:hypothetical protein